MLLIAPLPCRAICMWMFNIFWIQLMCGLSVLKTVTCVVSIWVISTCFTTLKKSNAILLLASITIHVPLLMFSDSKPLTTGLSVVMVNSLLVSGKVMETIWLKWHRSTVALWLLRFLTILSKLPETSLIVHFPSSLPKLMSTWQMVLNSLLTTLDSTELNLMVTLLLDTNLLAFKFWRLNLLAFWKVLIMKMVWADAHLIHLCMVSIKTMENYWVTLRNWTVFNTKTSFGRSASIKMFKIILLTSHAVAQIHVLQQL